MIVGHVGISKAVVSSYSDLDQISSQAKEIHFRKFVSQPLLDKVLEQFSDLERITMSESAYKRMSPRMIYKVQESKLQIRVSSLIGRPSLLERNLI